MLKFVLVIPKDVSSKEGVCIATWPTGFSNWRVICEHFGVDFYSAGADRRQIWVLEGDENEINKWIQKNSDMVTEKTFNAVEAIGKELQPERDGIAHRIVTENEKIVSEGNVPKRIPVFNLEEVLNEYGIKVSK